MFRKPLVGAVLFGGILTLVLDYVFAFLLDVAPLYLKNLKNLNGFSHLGNTILNKYVLSPGHTLQMSFQNPVYQKGQLVMLALFVFLVIRGWWTHRNRNQMKDAADYGAYGTARWATRKEIFDPKHITSDLQQEGTILAKQGGKPIIQHNESRLNRNVAVFGGSGSGKTQSYIIPNILNTREKSIVVTDPKGELYEKTSQCKKRQGYTVRVVNFINMDKSDRYNPLDYVEKETDARRVAKTLITNTSHPERSGGNKFWVNAEESFLTALILYVKHCLPSQQQHFGSVYSLLTQAGTEAEMDKVFGNLEIDHPARRAYGAIKLIEDEEVRSGVFVTTAVTLSSWANDEIRQFTAASDFHLKDIGQEKIMLYVILPIADDTWRPLISNFFTQLFQQLYDLADHNNNRMPRPVRVLLDEFANIGRIPNFAERLSTTRSYGIEVSMIFQSVGQLRDRYGHEQADEIIGNCDARLFIGTTAYDSAKYFSDLLGKTTIQISSQSASKSHSGESESESSQYTGRSLMTPDELLRLEENQAILLLRGKYPMNVSKAWTSSFPEFQEALRDVVSRFSYDAPARAGYSAFQYQSTVPEQKNSPPTEIGTNAVVTSEIPDLEEIIGDELDGLEIEDLESSLS